MLCTFGFCKQKQPFHNTGVLSLSLSELSSWCWCCFFCSCFFSMYLNTCYGLQSLRSRQVKQLHLITATPAMLQSVSYQLSLHFPVASAVRPLFDIQHDLFFVFFVFHRIKDEKKKEACDLSFRRWWIVGSSLQIKVLLSEMTTWWQHCVSSSSHKHVKELTRAWFLFSSFLQWCCLLSFLLILYVSQCQ